MTARLRRQEIKRDEFVETVGGAVGWLQEHGRKLMLGVLGLLLLALAFTVWRVVQSGRGEAAGEALGRALAVLEAPVGSPSPSPEDPDDPSFADEAQRRERARQLFGELAESYSGTDAGAIAQVYLGDLAAEAGDPERAREHWEAFLDRKGDHMLAAEVRLNLLALARQQGRGEELVDELRAELDSGTSVLPEPMLLNQLALTLEELGREREAVEVYQRLADEHPLSPYAGTARERTAALGAAARS